MWETDGERENIEHCGNIASKNVSLNGGMTERRKITLNPKTRNGGKSPHILKRGTVENHPKS